MGRLLTNDIGINQPDPRDRLRTRRDVACYVPTTIMRNWGGKVILSIFFNNPFCLIGEHFQRI